MNLGPHNAFLFRKIPIAGCACDVVRIANFLVSDNIDKIPFCDGPDSIISLSFDCNFVTWDFVEIIEIFNHPIQFFQIGSDFQEVKHLIGGQVYSGLALRAHSPIYLYVVD